MGKPEHDRILVTCLERQREVEAEPAPPRWRAWAYEEWEFRQQCGPDYAAGAWFGDLRDHERQRLLRAIRALERAGLLTIHCRWGRRLSHIRLTPRGLKVARELASGRSPA